MKTAAAFAPVSLAAFAIFSLASLTGCGGPEPLVAAEPVPEADVWVEQANPWTVHTEDGLTVQGPPGVAAPSKVVRVPGGLWICGEAGVAVFDQAAGTWKQSSFAKDFPSSARPTCAFDARSLTEAALYAGDAGFDGYSSFCRPGDKGWKCAPTDAWDPDVIVVTEGKIWYITGNFDAVGVTDEAGTRSFPLEGYLYGDLQHVPGSELVAVTAGDHVLQLDGTTVKKIHIDDPYASGVFDGGYGGSYPLVPAGPDHYYSVASHTSKDEDCHFSWTSTQCTTTAVHWSEVTVVEITTGGSAPIASHREDGAEWGASGRLSGGELRVQAGEGWYRLP